MGVLSRPPAPVDADHPAAADLLRVVAAWAVATFHIWQQSWFSLGSDHWQRAGSIGVDLLVMLSAALVFARLARGGWTQRLLPRAGCTVLGALALVWLNAQLRAQAYAAEFQRYQLVNRMPLALAAAAVLVGFGLGLTPPRPVRRTLAWLSALSYSFYLWHQQLTVFLKYDLHLPAWTGTTPPNQLGDTVWMQQAHALYWTAAIAVTLAAYYGVEKPIAKRLHGKKG